ncbi:hypothetical protein GCK72_024231 [Caenorhabditis remanei]|uniref:Uncharacterized protein n=1 Tax=Caenorhabditis remanei TaxID=31234 RepID=A0A6A5FZ79_CAERE|nr:hypothetical protein GCK72_024231 [Caenorhabditis remanei]KAF1747765.1 hypothetical protein GCK72_024231 [Caenorhabditis remanei]
MLHGQAMAAVQIAEHDTTNWNHFEADSHLHLEMQTRFLPHVSVLLAAIALAWYYETFDFGFFKYSSKKKGDAVDELLKKKHQVIGKECIPNTNTCFLIVDSYYLENGRLTTKRDILLEENTEYSLTGVEVESTKPVSWENTNSRDWPVNKLVINSRYARLLVAAGFIMESLTFDENDHNDVLVAGLGGGVMSNFLSEISYLNIDTTVVEKEDFIINLAENYFDHFETDQMRIVHADIVDFLRKYDKKYDVIIVDACENKKSDVMCPVPEIFKKESIQLLKKRLTLKGCVAVNVYLTKEAAETEKTIFELFSNEFNSCFFLEYFKDKKLQQAFLRLFRGRVQAEDPNFPIRLRIYRLLIGIRHLEISFELLDMLNQQHNQGGQQLLNVQRPHQIQPPGQHRGPPQGQNMQQNQMQQNQMQQNQMQQGQQINMGQSQMANMQGQRQVGQPGPSSQQMQQPQGHMMNMGQQIRPQQNQQQQPQMMAPNAQQQQPMQQMRGIPQQQQMRNMTPQGQQMQSPQQPQMNQMRMQQNPQTMPQQQRVPVQNMQQNMQQGQSQNLRMVPPQTNPAPRMQPPHQTMTMQQQQQGGPQNMNRPSPQPPHQGHQQQQGGSQNMNTLTSQQSSMPNLHQIMSRPPLQLPQGPITINLNPNAQPQIRILPIQPINQPNLNNGSPQQHPQMQQVQQNMNGAPQQQQMRMQQQDSQMQQGPIAMNGPPQQQQGRNTQVTPKQRQQGSNQNTPRMNPPQLTQQQPMQQPVQQQMQGQPNQPIRPINQMPQGRQMPPNQQRQMQQQSLQAIHQPQPIQQPTVLHQLLPAKSDAQQQGGVITFDADKMIHINGEHAIINGQQYKLVQMTDGETQQAHTLLNQQQKSNQHGQSNQHQQQQTPHQQNRNVQQRRSNTPMQNQQGSQQMQNQQSMQNSSNMNSPQHPPVLQQQQPMPAKAARQRNRYKKTATAAALESKVIKEDTPVSEALRMMPNNELMQHIPTSSNSNPPTRGRKILPPSLTPVAPLTSHGPTTTINSSTVSQPHIVQQGRNVVQVGGMPPNRQMNTPMKNGQRNPQPLKPTVLSNQNVNGRPQVKQSLPSTSQPKPLAKKENMTSIRDAIALHVSGERKMTPEYHAYVHNQLFRVMEEMELLEMWHDQRYISVQRLLNMVNYRSATEIKTPEKPPRPSLQPTEDELEPEPADETPEAREKRYDGYMKTLVEAYPEKKCDVKFATLDDVTIRKEVEFYRKQDMKNRETHLREIVNTLPEEKQTKAKIEYLGLGLLEFQEKLRKEVMSHTVLVPPTEFLINPWSIRRTKHEYILELKQHPDRAALEKKRKSTNYAFLQSLAKHTREFKEFHKNTLNKHRKVHKSMQQYITNEAKRVAREEMKNEKLRIQKLIQEDEEGYRAMLDSQKDRRLVYLLEQTDDYIKSLCDLLKQQQAATGGVQMKQVVRKEYEGLAEEDKVKSILDKARNEEDEYENKTKLNLEDYYTTAHGIREEITQQHYSMGGGNPTMKLKPYQLKGLEWMVSLYNNNLNGILADEMGLGKTIQTIAFITYLMEIKKTSGPFLVIVPLSTIPNWQNEFDKWAPNVHLIVFKGNKENRKANEPVIKSGKFNVLLTTFEYVIREKALLGKLRWKYMMIDEGHRLKNQHCKLTEMLNTRFQCQRRLLITGTPLQNKLPELWALLNFLLPTIFSSCSTFEQWFNAPFEKTGEKVELTSEETMLIIRRLHKVLRPFLLRRLKKEVESELPDKMEFVVKCEMSGLQKVLYKHMQKGLLLDGKTNTGSRSLMNTMVHLRKLCNHPFLFNNVEDSCKSFWNSKFITATDLYRVSGKLELLDRILPKLRATGHRVLMFFQMTAMMTVVEDYLAGGTINYLRLDGSTKPDERGALLDKFNAPNSKYFLFMLSTRAGGLGLNLQTADTVIIFDSDWNPHQDMQAQDRAHRIGQKAEVRVFRLITSNSVEEKILASARFKLNVDEKVIQAGKFDNRSTGAERRQILENIIKAENESGEDEDVPNDEEINDILSRSEDEFELFQKMDQERLERDRKNKAKPRLCGDDEIPRDILRAADETDYIEKAKEEGRVPYLEVMPGSRRTRKEVDYSTDTMSDDRFLEKLFDGDDAAPAKPDAHKPDVAAVPRSEIRHTESTPSTSAPPSKTVPATKAPEDVHFAVPKLPAVTFKVPRLLPKSLDDLKRKHTKSESESIDLTPKKVRKDVENSEKKETEKTLKRKIEQPTEPPIIDLTGEPQQKYVKISEEAGTPSREEPQVKERKEKKHKHRSDDESTPKKKKHRDRDREGSSERRKKHKKHHRQDEESSPSVSHHLPGTSSPTVSSKHEKESPLKILESASKVFDRTDSPSVSTPVLKSESSPLSADTSLQSTSSDSTPKPRLTLKFKMPVMPPPPPILDVDNSKLSDSQGILPLKFKIPTQSPEKTGGLKIKISTKSLDLPKLLKMKEEEASQKILPLKFKIPIPPADVSGSKVEDATKTPEKSEKKEKTPEKVKSIPSSKFKIPIVSPDKPPRKSKTPKKISDARNPEQVTPEKEKIPPLKFKMPFLSPQTTGDNKKTLMESPETPKPDTVKEREQAQKISSLKFKMPVQISEKTNPTVTTPVQVPEEPKVNIKEPEKTQSIPPLKFKIPVLTPEKTNPTVAAPVQVPEDLKVNNKEPEKIHSIPPLKFKMPLLPETSTPKVTAPSGIPEASKLDTKGPEKSLHVSPLEFKVPLPPQSASEPKDNEPASKVPTIKFKMPKPLPEAVDLKNETPVQPVVQPAFSSIYEPRDPIPSIPIPDVSNLVFKVPALPNKVPEVSNAKGEQVAQVVETPESTIEKPIESTVIPDLKVTAPAVEDLASSVEIPTQPLDVPVAMVEPTAPVPSEPEPELKAPTPVPEVSDSKVSTKPLEVTVKPTVPSTNALTVKIKLPTQSPEITPLKVKLPIETLIQSPVEPQLVSPTSTVSTPSATPEKKKKDPEEKKRHKEEKKKAREGETEEERRARKEAKRLKRESEGKTDDAKREEKLARKAARKEEKRAEKQKRKSAAGSVDGNSTINVSDTLSKEVTQSVTDLISKLMNTPVTASVTTPVTTPVDTPAAGSA